MKHRVYRPTGVCSTKIEFDLDDERIRNVAYTGGCNGNLKSIAALVEGQDAKHVEQLLSGIKCGFKQTSCGDQLARAIRENLA